MKQGRTQRFIGYVMVVIASLLFAVNGNLSRLHISSHSSRVSYTDQGYMSLRCPIGMETSSHQAAFWELGLDHRIWPLSRNYFSKFEKNARSAIWG